MVAYVDYDEENEGFIDDDINLDDEEDWAEYEDDNFFYDDIDDEYENDNESDGEYDDLEDLMEEE
ncbi:MAG: hypothetical protein WDA06_15790 [Phenylobacterium sp.]